MSSGRICANPECCKPIIRRVKESITLFRKRKYCEGDCRGDHTAMKTLARANATPPAESDCQVCTKTFYRKRNDKGLWAESLYTFYGKITCGDRKCITISKDKKLFAPKRKPRTLNDDWAGRTSTEKHMQEFASNAFTHKVLGAQGLGAGR